MTVDMEYLYGVHNVNGPKVRRFEARWLEEQKVEAVVQSTWEPASGGPVEPTLLLRTTKHHDDLNVWD
jgi:hypothetical protein